jgi:hypothetical protein
MGTRGVNRKNLKKAVEVKVGNLICIKRIWILTPVCYIFGVVLDVRKTKWDKDYRILKMLTTDGIVSDEPLDIVRDINCYEIIA